MGNNCKPQSLARRRFSGLPGPFGQGRHADSFSVARVRPRTSKGITDLLLLNLVRLVTACPSKKIYLYAGSKNHTPRRTNARQHTRAHAPDITPHGERARRHARTARTVRTRTTRTPRTGSGHGATRGGDAETPRAGLEIPDELYA